MDTSILVDTGLTKPQAVAYTALLTHSPISPPQLSKIICETRSNTYKVLEQLELMSLVIRDETTNKIRYIAKSPSNLQLLLDRQEEDISIKKKKLSGSIAKLEQIYFEHTTQPGVTFEQGTDGIINVFKDYANTGKDLFLVRTWKDRDYMGKGALSIWRKRPSTKGIVSHFLGPDTESASQGKIDEKYLIDKTWMSENDYTSPVEWCAYGDKLAIISYGKEASSTIIQSPQISEAFKQLHNLLTKNLRQAKGYDKFPIKAKLSDDPVIESSPEYKTVVRQREAYIKKEKSGKAL